MQVLVIEDSEVDFLMVERALGDQCELQRSPSLRGGLEMAARESFDLVILDLNIDDSRGFETFEKAHTALSRIPILVLSGTDDEELALKAVSSGAQDYIPKSRLLNYPLDRAARYAVERRRAEEAARASEQKYQALIDMLPTAVYTCDPRGLITYCNKMAVELWGRTPRLGDSADRFSGSLKLFTADGIPVPHDKSWMAKALSERKGFNGREAIIERPDGERRDVLCHANPVLDENQNLLGGINVMVDVTRQRQAESKLRESERFARATVNSLAAHIAILDEKGNILAINTAWQRFAEANGMSSCGFGVRNNYLTICEQSAGPCDEIAYAAVEGIRSVLAGAKNEFELEYPCHSPNEERWFMMRVNPFEGDGPKRVVVSHENITARKTAERLAVEQLSLREAVAGMEQVLGVVGHELRTPLAALRAISEFLTTAGARETAEADQFLHEISRQVRRMSDTVNNILEAARLNSGRARWTWSHVDLASTVTDAIESIQPLIDRQRVEICHRVDSAAAFMSGDSDAIRRLTINLLSNALKHTTQGQIEVLAQKYSDDRGHWIELSVRDTGCGIPSELSARLGEAFALNSGVVGANHISGTGLGLAICKGISKAHGGELSIESAVGKGTKVTAKLRADLEAAVDGDTVRLHSEEAIAA